MATIISIHGLANKPAELTLTKCWKDALEEGLKQNMDLNPGINFELVYWADQMYDASIPDHENKGEILRSWRQCVETLQGRLAGRFGRRAP